MKALLEKHKGKIFIALALLGVLAFAYAIYVERSRPDAVAQNEKERAAAAERAELQKLSIEANARADAERQKRDTIERELEGYKAALQALRAKDSQIDQSIKEVMRDYEGKQKNTVEHANDPGAVDTELRAVFERLGKKFPE